MHASVPVLDQCWQHHQGWADRPCSVYLVAPWQGAPQYCCCCHCVLPCPTARTTRLQAAAVRTPPWSLHGNSLKSLVRAWATEETGSISDAQAGRTGLHERHSPRSDPLDARLLLSAL